MSTSTPDAPARAASRTWGTKRQRIALGVLLAFCVITRVGWVVHIRDANPAATTSLDTPSYVQPARALAQDGTLNLRPGSNDPIFLRTPGYPVFMGAVFAIHESETLFLVIQALISCLVVLAAYLIATRLWSATAGLVAAVIVAIEPLQFAASGTLLTESVSSLALLCAVGIGFRVFVGGVVRPKWCALLGLAVAVATLIRPTTYYLPIFAVILLAVSARRAGLRNVAVGFAMFVLPLVVLVGGWQVRNDLEVGSWRFSGIEAQNLFHYRGADALGRGEGIGTKAAIGRLNRQLDASPLAVCNNTLCSPTDPSRPGPFYDEMFSQGLDVVKAHPAETAESAVRGLGRELFGPGTDTVGRYFDIAQSTPLKLLLAGGLLCFYVAFGVGLILVIRRPEGRALGHVFALGTTVYVLLLSAGPETYARFRGPIMPVLALYAAFGIVTVVGRLRTPGRQQ